ncbi:MAG TPA: ethanolamine ammonia lyase-activating protein [Chloroflexota bacterium]|nr:ethanolamine ammonia lyase-activating protein [Chloroflexota bacterium]
MAGKRSESKTGYELWLDREGIPISEGYGVDNIQDLPRGKWERTGGLGAYIQLEGMQGVTGMYVAEIPAGGALNPERHLYQEVICVLRGSGITQVWQDGQEKQSFEWQAGSLFAPPLNAWHQLFNGSSEPAVFMALTDAPLAFDLYRDPDFILNNPHQFRDRFDGEAAYFAQGEERTRTYYGGTHWETNFIADVSSAVLDAAEYKAAGGHITAFEISGNSLVGHIAEWPVGRYHKAHYHAAGAILLGLRSEGYVIMWPNELGPRPYESGHGDQVVKVNWGPGSVYSPPQGWFHQHFNTGGEPARQLALRFGSRRHPVGFHLAAKRSEDGTATSMRLGGTLIEYEDEDPEIRRAYRTALQRNGVEYQMPEVVYA